MIDTHSHLFASDFDEDIEDCIKRCKENNVNKVVLVGFSKETNMKAMEYSKKYDIFYPTAGVHPDEADDNYLKPKNVEEEEKKLQVNDVSSNVISFNSFDNSQKSEAEEMPTGKSSEVNSNLQDDDKFMADVHTFPDFSDIEDRDKKEESKNSRIEEDVMDAASKYIESIMSNNK